MGKRGGAGTRRAPNSSFGSNNTISLREETTGKKRHQKKGGSSANVKHLLKVEHLKKLAVWVGGESSVSVPSFAAFFGQRLASVGESLGVSPDPSLFSCRRCETILQPGFNCTIRIEKNYAKARRRSKNNFTSSKNIVVHTCHFCSHRNLMGGTPKGHLKQICPSKIKTTEKATPAKSNSHRPAILEKASGGKDEAKKMDEPALPPLPATSGELPISDSPATPMVKTVTTLLEAKKRKRNRSTNKKPSEPENSSNPANAEKSIGVSSKRRKKSWTTLKEFADSKDQGKNQDIANLPIPFFL
ncbi:uncharacterized protein LOC133778415 [Humulus lupulus]|uniref:uncharacterized protein LOC133778415 n=1 Tax=Humulus lupulus TaxID=3486 RepID=UPI002B416687|nr:uncharacterized protein LOC133778415 [Humulus lupulus]